MTVIIDATEITVEQPALPELQQLTLSNFKNCNTYRLTPFGAVTFVSDLYSEFISDKKLTRQCGLLVIFEQGNSVMADRARFRRFRITRSNFEYTTISKG